MSLDVLKPTSLSSFVPFRNQALAVLAWIAVSACGREPMGDRYAGGSEDSGMFEDDSAVGEGYTSVDEGFGSDASNESENPLPLPQIWGYDIDCPGYTDPAYGCHAGSTYDFTFSAQNAEKCDVILDYSDAMGLPQTSVTEVNLDPPLNQTQPNREQSAQADLFTAGQPDGVAYVTVSCANRSGITDSDPMTLDYH